MVAVATTGRVPQLLRLLPGPVHKALDAWSYRVALKRRARRQQIAQGAPAR